jgi:hypothetical protein
MNDKRRTDEEIAQLWADEIARARRVMAERQSVQDAMRAAGFATPKQELLS